VTWNGNDDNDGEPGTSSTKRGLDRYLHHTALDRLVGDRAGLQSIGARQQNEQEETMGESKQVNDQNHWVKNLTSLSFCDRMEL
jgi:hypothetical protein